MCPSRNITRHSASSGNASEEQQQASILPGLVKSFGPTFIFAALLKLVNDALIFVSPHILKYVPSLWFLWESLLARALITRQFLFQAFDSVCAKRRTHVERLYVFSCIAHHSYDPNILPLTTFLWRASGWNEDQDCSDRCDLLQGLGSISLLSSFNF